MNFESIWKALLALALVMALFWLIAQTGVYGILLFLVTIVMASLMLYEKPAN